MPLTQRARDYRYNFQGFGEPTPPTSLCTPPASGGVCVSSAVLFGRFYKPNPSKGGHENLSPDIRRRGLLRTFTLQEHVNDMGKRTSTRSKKQFSNTHETPENFQLHAMPGSWDPVEAHRDQSFIRHVKPRSEGQQQLMDAIESSPLTVALGPAGTGKTYLAIAAAVKALDDGQIDRIVLSRPAIEAGETLGYLPGTMEEKMSPYLRPLYDALGERMGGKRLRQYMADGTIEIAPIAYMRGRTLNNAFVVIDEAQNCTYGQIKMLLTRLGWHSTMVITGDPDQTDLLPGVSGLADIADRLNTLNDIAIVKLTHSDVVRHPLVACMLAVL